MDQATVTGNVKAISIIEYIGGGLGILFGLIMLFGGSFLAGIWGALLGSEGLGALLTGIVVVASIIVIIYNIFLIFVAANLAKFKNWARITLIVLAILGALNGLFNIFTVAGIVFGIIFLAINVYILIILFNKDAAPLFNK